MSARATHADLAARFRRRRSERRAECAIRYRSRLFLCAGSEVVQLQRMFCGLLLSAAAVAKGRLGFRCLDLSVCAQLKKNAFMLVVHPTNSECFALPSNPLTKRAVEACASSSTLQVNIRRPLPISAAAPEMSFCVRYAIRC